MKKFHFIFLKQCFLKINWMKLDERRQIVMELRQLRQFYEVCQQGSFSAAGERLYMTQQAVGKSMKQLEDELAVVLFIREKTGVSLTPQGKYLEGRCKELFEFVNQTEDEIQQIGANCPLQTRILLPDATAKELEDSLEIFFQTPFIACTIGATETTERVLLEGDTDAFISVDPVQNDELMVYPLLNLPFCCVIPAADRSITKKEMTLRDFRQKSFVVMRDWIHVRSRLSNAFKEQNVKLKEKIFVDKKEEGLRLAEEGKGYFLLPEKDTHDLDLNKVRVVPLKKRSFSVNLYYIFRKNDNCQKEIQRVYEFLKIRLLH